MKILFDNIALIDKNLALEHVKHLVTSSLQNWRKIPYEVCSLFYCFDISVEILKIIEFRLIGYLFYV